MAEIYLGDGLYVTSDGYEITLRAPRENGDHFVVLEPSVLDAFLSFALNDEAKKHILDRWLANNPGAATVNCVRGTFTCSEKQRLQAENEALAKTAREMIAAANAWEQKFLNKNNWKPISEYPEGSFDSFLLCHQEKKWIRMGRKMPHHGNRWYYSGNNQVAQWVAEEEDEPTHWDYLPGIPKP